MTAGRLVGGLLAAVVLLLVFVVATNTEWVDMAVPTPARGEARTDPFYAARRFAEALGATTIRPQTLVVPSPNSVIVVSTWNWNLSASRQQALERWVESGGRLVVDHTLSGSLETFERWSGVEEHFDDDAAERFYENYDENAPAERCLPVRETVPDAGRTYSVCDLDFAFLEARGTLQWALRNDYGYQAVRVPVGRGSVTVLTAVPFTWQEIFEGDHARLFVAATQLTAGDHIVFVSEAAHPSVLALLWRHGAPAVSLALAVVALAVWRGAVRFGPLEAVPDQARRSMAEQIRGTGRYILQHGDGAALHAATVRALVDAARRKIPAYGRLSRPQRAAAFSKLTGMDGAAITSAIEDVGKRRPRELASTIGLIESARRQLLAPANGSRKGRTDADRHDGQA